jgi:aminoglycoside phosphotransferase (APT) family kinase protein
MLWRDCECVAEGTVRKADGQIGIEHEDTFADRLHDIHRVDVVHGSGSCTPSDDETGPRKQTHDLAYVSLHQS